MNKDLHPTVFVIVLNYNGADILNKCLASIFQSNYSALEVVLVDNNSIDESFQQARQKFSKAHFIKNSTNIGFAAGNNVGLRFALEKFADFIFILNNDAIIEKETISNLVKIALKNKSAGIISPLILNSKGSIWFSGGSINWLTMKAFHTKNIKDISNNKPFKTEYASGCAMLIRSSVFKKIGLFDERFFLYYEDTDFSYRAQKAGYEIIIDPNSKIKHFEQSNTKNSSKLYWLVLSGLIFFKINSNFIQKVWLVLYSMLRKLKNSLSIIFSKNSNSIQIKKAYDDFKKISF